MVEAMMFWNEPNNKSHWASELDPEWRLFGEMTKGAARAVQSENPKLLKVLGGISPIDAGFIGNLGGQEVLKLLDVVAVHGFPLDWNNWSIDEWPAKLQELRSVTSLPVWVSEVGVSSFGAEEVQEFGLRRTAELLGGRAERIHWYSLYDLPKEWPATTRHREAEGSAYYRHFHMGLIREDGTPKRALKHFSEFTPALGICQWFHYEDHRLENAVRWLRELGVRHLRTGLSWADSFRPNAEAWFDRQMAALESFEVTVTCCFTPEHLGLERHHTSPPREPEQFAEFCATIAKRYSNGAAGAHPQLSPDFQKSPRFSHASTSVLDRICAPTQDASAPPKTLIVAAHPGDETIGAGSCLARLRDATVLHVTDGAPRDMRDAWKAGCPNRAAYCELRGRELESVFDVAGMRQTQVRGLGIIEQEASLHLVELTRRLAAILAVLQPEVVLTHPYEGGHPDHDATAFAVHTACRLLAAEDIPLPQIVEMACDHGENGAMITSRFLEHPSQRPFSKTLAKEDQALKRRLFHCHLSQRAVLRSFSTEVEQFRLAPEYDFAVAPQEGALLYEAFDWGVTGARWRKLAQEAWEKLDLIPKTSTPLSEASSRNIAGP